MFHGWQYLTPADRENILRGIEDGGVYGGPYHLELDWVDKCNASCFFCNSARFHGGGASIPWERAERLLTEAAEDGLRSVRLSGGGEPTLHPNLPDLFGFLARHNIVLDNLNTNGTLLTERIQDALAGVRIRELRISLNYSSPESYAEGMGLPPRLFDRTVEMIRNLAGVRRRAPAFDQLILQFFVTRGTARDIRECYALGRDLGADVILFRELWGVDGSHYFTAADLPDVVAQLREVIREDWRDGLVVSHLESHGIGEHVAAIYDELRAELGGPPPKPAEEIDYPTRYCYIGWYSMTVVGTQAVYPCCYLLPCQHVPPLGSLETHSLREIWRGEAYARFRREMRDYFLLQRQLPLFERRTSQITRTCATHTDCPITRSMCDEEFYREAEHRLAGVRARPGVRLWRLLNRAGRVLERKVLGRPN